MKRKTVFLDVDGTLIDYEARCPDSAREAVNKARQAGHKVYICTGCSKAEILKRNLPRLDGMIGGNGCYVEDDGEVILHQSLSREQTRSIADWCRERNLGFYLESNAGIFCNDRFLEQGEEVMIRYALGKGADQSAAADVSTQFLAQMIHVPYEEMDRDDVNKISFVLSDYQDHLDSARAFPDLEANTWGGKGEHALFGDLGPAGITKKSAIQALLRHLQADQADTIAFGDAKIDLSMFELCGFNVAMGNGGPEIKGAADYVTADVNDDGLYKAFEHLGLFEPVKE